ncbi:MAG: hypothetical protein DLM57_07950 [Pseudonocardiales bacterium]|nr:MAG: hypothetical protein DLM57_07950 [Pseudonocardiales bacterium]
MRSASPQRLSALLRVRRGSPWQMLVPVVCLIAGIGFGASHHDARGTELRSPVTANLRDLVRAAEARVKDADRAVAQLQAQVTAATRDAGQADSAVAGAQAKVSPVLAPGGLTAVRGPGIVVVLNDAASVPPGAEVDPNQLVVHQADLQAVVNSLWAGGAEAMTIAGQRVIATSAVRCVGNTLLLNGEVYSPPFRVAAIGPYQRMQSVLDKSPGVALFKEAASYYGLGYTVESQDRVDLPAYRGPIRLIYAKAVPK